MQRWAMDLLACPKTGQPLRLEDERGEGDTITTGTLVAPGGERYPIVNGIPRFAGDYDDADASARPSVKPTGQDAESVESFGWEWNKLNFDKFFLNWRDHLAVPTFGSLDYFKGKTIVDCGAGSGMHSRWMLEAGASRVVSIDLSQSVDGIMPKNLAGFEDRSLIIQGDIANPPLRRGAADAYACLNVIQHTQDPPATLAGMYRRLGPGQELFFNIYRLPVYWRSQRLLLLREKVRRHFTARLPKPALLGLCKLLALGLFVPGLRNILDRYIVCGPVPPGPNERKRRYHQAVLNTYDWYGSHAFQFHYSTNDILKMFDRVGITLDRAPGFMDWIVNHKPGRGLRLLGPEEDASNTLRMAS